MGVRCELILTSTPCWPAPQLATGFSHRLSAILVPAVPVLPGLSTNHPLLPAETGGDAAVALKAIAQGEQRYPLVFAAPQAPSVGAGVEAEWADKDAVLRQHSGQTVTVRWPVGANQVGVFVRKVSETDPWKSGPAFAHHRATMLIMMSPRGSSQSTLGAYFNETNNEHHGLVFDAIPGGQQLRVPEALRRFSVPILSLAPSGIGLPFHNHAAGYLVSASCGAAMPVVPIWVASTSPHPPSGTKVSMWYQTTATQNVSPLMGLIVLCEPSCVLIVSGLGRKFSAGRN